MKLAAEMIFNFFFLNKILNAGFHSTCGEKRFNVPRRKRFCYVDLHQKHFNLNCLLNEIKLTENPENHTKYDAQYGGSIAKE